MGIEKRKSAREKFDIPVVVYAQDGSTLIEECNGVDISASGISVKAIANIALGTYLTLSFILNRETFSIKGTVQSRTDVIDRHRIYGIKFLDISPYHVKLIGKHFKVAAPEKRKEERKDCSIPVAFSVSEDTLPSEGRLINISTGGVFLETETLIMRDTFLRLQFELPPEKFDIRGKVTGMTTTKGLFVYRLLFVYLTAEQNQAIENYLL